MIEFPLRCRKKEKDVIGLEGKKRNFKTRGGRMFFYLSFFIYSLICNDFLYKERKKERKEGNFEREEKGLLGG